LLAVFVWIPACAGMTVGAAKRRFGSGGGTGLSGRALYCCPIMGANPQNQENAQMRTYVISALTGAFALGLATTAFAAAGQFDDMCSWGLANHKDVKTDCSVNATIKGKTYCFSSPEAKANFMKDPDANLAKAESFYKSEHKG
jgi:YHS domain-containing protein